MTYVRPQFTFCLFSCYFRLFPFSLKIFLSYSLHRYRGCRRKEWSQHTFVRNDRFMHHRVKRSSFSTTALSTRQLLAYWKFDLLAPLLSQQPNSSHFHVAKIWDDETGHRDSRVIFQAYRLPRRSCHCYRKQYFLNRPYKPTIHFPPPSRNFPNTSSLLLGSLNTARDISTTLKS